MRFTALRDDERHEFLISREALDDLIQDDTGGDEGAMREAFDKHVDRIQSVVMKALAFKYRHPQPDGWILLQTRDF